MRQMRAPPLQLLWIATCVPQQRDLPTAIALVLLSMRFSLQNAVCFIKPAEPERELNHSQYGVSVTVVVHSRPLALDGSLPGLGAVQKQGAEKPSYSPSQMLFTTQLTNFTS